MSETFEQLEFSVPEDPDKEGEFTIDLLVQIRAYGLPEVHRSNMIARVSREVELLFGSDNATVSEVTPIGANLANNSDSLWLLPAEVVEAQVQSVD